MMRPYSTWRAMRAYLALAFATGACVLSHTAAAQGDKYLPFKVYVGTVGSYEITKGVNTIKVNDGFLPTGTIPVSPNGVYRIKAGQALALMYQVRNPGSQRVDFGKLPTEGFAKVIRKVDGKEVQMENYPGVSTRFELVWVNKGVDDAYTISRKLKSKFNPPLPAADFDRTDGIFLMNSADPIPALKEPAFAKDVNKVAGKILTVHYLVSAIDANAFFTVEVDFTDVKPGSLSSAKTTGAADQAANDNAQKARDERAAAQQKAAEERADAKKQKEEERAAAKDAKAEARAEAAAERAKKRAEAAAARKATP
jgi:hypothetical protein